MSQRSMPDSDGTLVFRVLWHERTNIWTSDFIVKSKGKIVRGSRACSRVHLQPEKGAISPDSNFSFDDEANPYGAGVMVRFINTARYCPCCRRFYAFLPEARNPLWKALQSIYSTSDRPKLAFLASWLAVGTADIKPWVIQRCKVEHYDCLEFERKNRRHNTGPWNFRDRVVTEIHTAVIELKRWLHNPGSESPEATKAEKGRCVARHVRRHGLTASERSFFQMMFGASALTKWITNKPQKNEQDNRLQIAS